MRILVIGINYAPERTSVAPFTTGLCEHLAIQGHQVKVVTAFPYYPEWRVWEGYRGCLYRREVIHGVEVRRVWHFVPKRASALLQRLAHDFSFSATAFWAALFAGKFDVIYCASPPPAAAIAALLLGRLRGQPYVIKLTDLASDAAIATDIVKNREALYLARAIEGFVYRNAAKIVCLCQGFIDRLKERNILADKLHIISDWADTERGLPLENAKAFRAANGLSTEDFVVLHTSNMGKKQDLLNVVRAAEISQGLPGLVWVLVGQGEERATLEKEVAARKLKNIRILPLQPSDMLAEMYSGADILLLNQKAAMEDAVIPSKLLTYMAAGRPILAAANQNSEAARQIRTADCGAVVPAEDPRALVDGAVILRENTSARNRFGANGRKHALAHFQKLKVLKEYESFFRHFDTHDFVLGIAKQAAVEH